MSASILRRPSSGVDGPRRAAPVRGGAQALRFLAGALIVAGLAGCAGSTAAPTVVTSLSAGQRAGLHLSGVTTVGAQGVPISATDTNRITQLVIADIQSTAPGVMDGAAAGAKTMRIVVTRYDEGSAGGRLMLAGVGQIRLDGDVTIVDRLTGQTVAEYKVSKQFAFGGIYGALTSIQDVEKGFSKSVAALLKSET